MRICLDRWKQIRQGRGRYVHYVFINNIQKSAARGHGPAFTLSKRARTMYKTYRMKASIRLIIATSQQNCTRSIKYSLYPHATRKIAIEIACKARKTATVRWYRAVRMSVMAINRYHTTRMLEVIVGESSSVESGSMPARLRISLCFASSSSSSLAFSRILSCAAR